MSLDKDTVARIARLARLKVPEEELAPLAGELSGILAWIEQLNEVDTSDVELLASVSDVTLPMRADKVTDGGVAANLHVGEDTFYGGADAGVSLRAAGSRRGSLQMSGHRFPPPGNPSVLRGERRPYGHRSPRDPALFIE